MNYIYKLDNIKIKPPVNRDKEKDIVAAAVSKKLRINDEQLGNLTIVRRSLDARKKNDIVWVYSAAFEIKCGKNDIERILRKNKDISVYSPVKYEPVPAGISEPLSSHMGNKCKGSVLHSGKIRPVVVGSGPAGLGLVRAIQR